VRKHAIDLATLLNQNEHIGEMIYDWNEPGKVLRVEIAQDKARQLGLSSEDVANVMNSIVSGVKITQVNDNIYLVNVVARAEDSERGSPDTLQNLQISPPMALRSRCCRSPLCVTNWSSRWCGAVIANRPSPSRLRSTAISSPPTWWPS
jgi:Cation/multidrug efflux pump